MNDIPQKQNRPEMIALLRAQRATYSDAKCIHGAVVLGALLFPVLTLVFNYAMAETKHVISLVALLAGLLEVVVLDRILKDHLKRAAKVQEKFDCEALGMQWNEFVCGEEPDVEDVNVIARKKSASSKDSDFLDWYPTAVGELPKPVGRILCQRENLVYDSRLRAIYGNILLIGGLALGAILFATWLWTNAPPTSFVVGVLAPMVPLLTWSARERSRQKATATTLAKLKSEVEKLWKKALAGDSVEVMERRSRELQDALFAHRSTSPLVFDFIYGRVRDRFDADMKVGAESRVAEYKKVCVQ